ncbi:phosphatidylinositol kinase- protein kinase tor1 [Boothiomyces sp. JEL0866]|nr:phosphatidylinositol kinase- protein kinase tor1 [Boothiomyces sp. JEL0866]
MELDSIFQGLERNKESAAVQETNENVNKRILSLIKSENPIHQLGGIKAINTENIPIFANYLRILLPNSENILEISKTIGKICTLSTVYLDFEINNALEWIQQKEKRSKAVIILNQIAIQNQILNYTRQIVDLIFLGLRDERLQVRINSGELLFNLLKQQNISIIGEMKRGFRMNSDAMHGSFIALLVLFKLDCLANGFDCNHCPDRTTGNTNRINSVVENVRSSSILNVELNKNEIITTIIKFKDKSKFKTTIIEIMAYLQFYGYYRQYMQIIMKYLSQNTPDSFISICKLIETPDIIKPLLECNDTIRNLLKNSDRVFDKLFSGRISDIYQIALEMAKDSNCFAVIQAKLFAMINNILTNDSISVYTKDIELALKVLQTFQFKKINVKDLVKKSLRYLHHENPQIRINSIKNFTKYIKTDEILSLGITDPDPTVRLAVFQSIESDYIYDYQPLYVAINDEQFEIREACLKLLVKLSQTNKSILPRLRIILIKLLNELEITRKPDSAKLLSIVANQFDIYNTVLYERLTKIENPDYIVLDILADLGINLDQLLEQILGLLSDGVTGGKTIISDHVRFMLLQTIHKIVNKTNKFYPKLFPLLIDLLKIEENQEIRIQALKLVGSLGAIDPSTLEVQKVSSDLVSQDQVFVSLIKILNDQSLQVHHSTVITTIINMFNTLGLELVDYLPKVVPAFLSIANSEFYYEQLGQLTKIVGQHIRNYLPDMIALLEKSMNLTLVQSLASTMQTDFKKYVPLLLPKIIILLDSETDRTLKAFLAIGISLNEYLNIVIPLVLQIYKPSAVKFIGDISRTCNLTEYSSRVVQYLLKALELPLLQSVSMDSLTILAISLKSNFYIYVPLIQQKIAMYNITHRFNAVITKLQNNELVNENAEEPKLYKSTKQLTINQSSLQKTWQVYNQSKEEWQEWIRLFSLELLKESPSHTLRACAQLASSYPQLSKDLFNTSFTTCLTNLEPIYEKDLVANIEKAVKSPLIPPEILLILLNLCEYLERNDKLFIDVGILGHHANRCHAPAKALHYKELEYIESPGNIEPLLSIYNQLDQHDSAIGLMSNHQFQESWYEKLQRWEDGLKEYEKKSDTESVFGRMRCLHQLGEWDTLYQLVQDKWGEYDPSTKRKMASFAAAAAWGKGEWSNMNEYIQMMKKSPDSSFFNAINQIHLKDYHLAQIYINQTRELLDTELKALLSESYNRAYNIIVRIQMLTELEEIIQNKTVVWNNRLERVVKSVDVWQRLLKVRSLLGNVDLDTLVKFASLCRKNGRVALAYNTLSDLLVHKDLLQNEPRLVYAILKHMWHAGNKSALQQIKVFTKQLTHMLGNSSSDGSMETTGDFRLLAKCCLKVGQWQKEDEITPEILSFYFSATMYDSRWYKAWHTWAFANYEIVAQNEKLSDQMPEGIVLDHVVPAIQGFFKSILLSKSSLQDTLRLLTLWFKYGHLEPVYKVLAEGIHTVSINTWLEVIPQLIARIHSPSKLVRVLVHQLLAEVGVHHPQALVYSLTVASKSQSVHRQKAALALLEKMRMHSANLVVQALLVSQELIRVSIVWQETWHDGLEEASRFYFHEKNIEGMFTTLKPLHRMLEKGPETIHEVEFYKMFGKALEDAADWCHSYVETRNLEDLNQAWDLYYQVFKAIRKQLPQLMSFSLENVSPRLYSTQNLDLVVPGSYKSGQVVKIQSFKSQLRVMSSKQRPRKLDIIGSDGVEYKFLLKGHEDLRQDERVMQLFGLVNTLFDNDSETFKRRLNIRAYPVIPLSPNSGLIGWVPDCDTMQDLIKEYRESRRILADIERRVIYDMAKDYDDLNALQKVEVFENAMDNTTGRDLYQILWLKSRNSEEWLSRRTTFTRSLAAMSMVGYILGLGDRHPLNIMISRVTGKVIHIDFGDCFEVAMHRKHFPERIPFRLTRMLVNAMEIGGYKGTYKITCEHVMRVLRANKDSLKAVLEAFVYDPLINWRLISEEIPAQEENVLDRQVLNKRALDVVDRINSKLVGQDFKGKQLDVKEQVEKLIHQATSVENLCQCYMGWCPFCVPPPLVFLQMLNNVWAAKATSIFAKLKIADHLRAGPKTFSEIALELHLNPDGVFRLLRGVASVGIVEHLDKERFRLTALGEHLISDVPGSLRGVMGACLGDSHWKPWGMLDEAIRTGKPPTGKALGVDSIWTYFKQDTEEAKMFAEAMSGFSEGALPLILGKIEIGDKGTIADIGGSYGSLISKMLEKYPNSNGILFDLPEVISTFDKTRYSRSVQERISTADGDFFESVPTADIYLLKHILHDWTNEDCLKILSTIVKCKKPSSKILLIEMIIPPPGTPSPTALLDLNMLAVCPGRERTVEEFQQLFAKVGLKLNKADLIEESPYGILEFQ